MRLFPRLFLWKFVLDLSSHTYLFCLNHFTLFQVRNKENRWMALQLHVDFIKKEKQSSFLEAFKLKGVSFPLWDNYPKAAHLMAKYPFLLFSTPMIGRFIGLMNPGSRWYHVLKRFWLWLYTPIESIYNLFSQQT